MRVCNIMPVVCVCVDTTSGVKPYPCISTIDDDWDVCLFVVWEKGMMLFPW